MFFYHGQNTVPVLCFAPVDLHPEMSVRVRTVLLLLFTDVLNIQMLTVEFLRYGLHRFTEIRLSFLL